MIAASQAPGRHSAIERLRAKARRVRALIVKETRQVLRDPSSIAIGIVLPVILILLFGFGLSLDVKNVPLAVVLEDSSYDASELIGSFQLSAYFRPQITHSMPGCAGADDRGTRSTASCGFPRTSRVA